MLLLILIFSSPIISILKIINLDGGAKKIIEIMSGIDHLGSQTIRTERPLVGGIVQRLNGQRLAFAVARPR